MRLEVKRIEIWSVVKITFLISLLIGFLFGLLYAAIISVGGTFLSAIGGEDVTTLMPAGALLSFFIVIMCTIFFSVFYTISAAVFAAIYNIFAKFTGGITLEVEKGDFKKEEKSSYILEKDSFS